jgi:hypothetical protein
MPRCAGSKGDGTPCERIVGASSRFCFAHDPQKASQRSRNASKAGRAGPLKELREVKGELRTLAADVLAGGVDRDDAAVASRILAVFLRAVEQERKVKELEDVLPRLAEIERRLDAEGGRRWG